MLQSSKCSRQGLACNDSATTGDFMGRLSGENADVGSDVNDCVPFCQADAMLEVAALFLDLSAEKCYICLAYICNVFAIVCTVLHSLKAAQTPLLLLCLYGR